MRTLRNKFASLAIITSIGLGSAGCIKRTLLAGQLASTRKASAAINTISDFEVARSAAFAGLAQFEGMHYLGPDIEDGVFLLTKGWAGASFGFIEDDMEQAEDLYGDTSEMYEYHKARAVAGYSRAIHYGTLSLERQNPGFDDARKTSARVQEWLKGFTDPEADVPVLFWTAQAWLSRTNLLKDDPLVVADLFVGLHMVERVIELDDTYNYGAAHILMGAYHARSALAKNELPDSKRHFDRALEINGGNALLTKVNLAVKYYCAMGEKENYVNTLNEVLEAGDVLPAQRLQNTIAKRRARRYLAESRMKRCGF